MEDRAVTVEMGRFPPAVGTTLQTETHRVRTVSRFQNGFREEEKYPCLVIRGECSL